MDIPTIIDAFLLFDIQICTSSSGYVNVLSGIGNDSSLGEQSLTLGSKWWLYKKFPDMDQKSFIASPASGNESWGGGRETLLILQEKSTWLSPSIDRCRIKEDILRSWSPPRSLIRPSAIGKYIFLFLGKYHFLCIESFWVDFRCVHRFQLLKVCNQYVTLPNSPRVQCVSEEQSK